MTHYDKIKALAARRREAGTEEEKAAVAREMWKLQEENPEEYRQALETLIRESAEEADSITVAEKLGQAAKFVSMAYIAEHYFGKSRSWLAHKLNGNTVNGKKAHFTPGEIQTLKAALADIAKQLGSISESL